MSNKFQRWLMHINAAEYYEDWRYKVWQILTWPFFRCHECYDGYYYPLYGVAPHWHDLTKTGSFVGSTIVYDKEEWPDNYVDTDGGCGVWYCPNEHCKNSRVNQQGKK